MSLGDQPEEIVSRYTDEMGRRWIRKYDARGRLVEEAVPDIPPHELAQIAFRRQERHRTENWRTAYGRAQADLTEAKAALVRAEQVALACEVKLSNARTLARSAQAEWRAREKELPGLQQAVDAARKVVEAAEEAAREAAY